MLMLRKLHGGFSLIELMVALVLGLVVAGAVIAFIASSIKVNAEAVQAIRLNQELRTISEIVTREIRRARSVADPLADIGSGCTPSTTCSGAAVSAIDNTTAGCIVFGYQGTPYGDNRVIRRTETSGVGAIVLARGTGALGCTSTGTVISSGVVDITNLVFDTCSYVDAGGITVEIGGCIDIEIGGRLVNGTNVIVKHYKTSTNVRSGA